MGMCLHSRHMLKEQYHTQTSNNRKVGGGGHAIKIITGNSAGGNLLFCLFLCNFFLKLSFWI